jgi:hypothetical protein
MVEAVATVGEDRRSRPVPAKAEAAARNVRRLMQTIVICCSTNRSGAWRDPQHTLRTPFVSRRSRRQVAACSSGMARLTLAQGHVGGELEIVDAAVYYNRMFKKEHDGGWSAVRRSSPNPLLVWPD